MAQEIKPEILAAIKEEYMNYVSLVALSKKYNVNLDSIKWHVNRKKDNWRDEREGHEKQVLAEFTGNKKAKLVKISKLSLKVMEKALEGLENQEDISIQDARNVSTILESMDKIIKLDEGKPTENRGIIENKPTSPQELKKRLSEVDPFLTLEEENEESNPVNPTSNNTKH